MNDIARDLLAWYDLSARSLPWRGIRNAYATWVSETMLQQTRVETVKDYYARFLARFPDIASLAEAGEDEVLKLWEGLGYYSRARNLHRGARQVMAEHGGELPHTAAELRGIAGIGPYTAGAIASIAFGERAAALDGNVIRVTSRLMGIREDATAPSGRRRLEAAVLDMLPQERPGDFNQALMDLGSGICTPGTPDCDACPLQARCDAFAAGDAESLPNLPVKRPPKEELWDVLILRQGDRVLMRRRTERLLQGLWVFPMIERGAASGLAGRVRRLTGLRLRGLSPRGEARHVFTHKVWQMRLFDAGADGEAAAPWQWFTPEEMRALAIPAAMRAAREAALSPQRETEAAGEDVSHI